MEQNTAISIQQEMPEEQSPPEPPPHHDTLSPSSWDGNHYSTSFSPSNNKNGNNNSNSSDNEDRVPFLEALSSVEVPDWLLHGHGVQVVLVSANGKTQLGQLSISSDKFTVKLSSVPKDNNNNNTSNGQGGGNGGLIKSGGGLLIFSATRTESSSTSSPSSGSTLLRSIDVGEMDRIQRGQATQQFETAAKSMMNASTTKSLIAKRINLLERMGESNRKLNVAAAAAAAASASMNDNASVGSTTSTNTTTTIEDVKNLFMLTLDPERSFSIIFRGAQTLDLMATNPKARDDICNALDTILKAYQKAKERVAADVQLLRYVWLDVVVSSKDHNNNNNKPPQYATVQQVGRVFAQINFFMKPRDLQANYEKFGKVLGLDRRLRKRGLTFDQLADFLHYIRRNSWLQKPVTVVWNDLFGQFMNNGKPRLTVSCQTFLEKFLHDKQGQLSATLEDVKLLFRQLHDMEISHNASPVQGRDHDDGCTRINKDQFEAYLLGSDNDAFEPQKEQLDLQSMHKPLSEYFINSSHNTYLIGDQYTSHSRVEMYSNALYRGCRCLELDIWDGGKNQSDGQPIPVVWHGHTMTSKIFFVDIIRTIKVFLNFHPDSFPIILSFENHCSIPYQQVMAQQLEAILGEVLYIPSETSLGLAASLPSPAQLRGMVVIKGRRPPDHRMMDDDNQSDGGGASDDDSDDDGPTSSIATSSVAGGDGSTSRPTPPVKIKDDQHHGIAPELARLTLLHGTKFKNWPDSIRSPHHHMHSFSENKVRSTCRHKEAADWIIYNQMHMSRTYPSGGRLDSSNYNPLLAWSTGCQMVALNFQTEDTYLRLNDGRFRENGNCGYVLKPSSLMTPKHELEFASSVPIRLTIQVLSGSCLPKPKGRRTGDCIDPWVRLSVFDVGTNDQTGSPETKTYEFATAVIRQNGFFPVWGLHQHDQYLDFVVETWAAAMLQLTVIDKNSKDEMVASCSIPISCLRKGIRSVKLYDATNTRSGAFDFASLLLDIDMAQVIAEI